MDNVKSWMTSVTIWGALLGWANSMFVLGMTAEDIGMLAAGLAGVASTVFTAAAVYGRIRANAKITK